MSLNAEQQEAFQLVSEGKSICLTGAAGSGKSFLINYIIRNLGLVDPEAPKTAPQNQGRKLISVTGLTGIASTYINGITLHSWAGIPVRQMAKAQILKSLMSYKAETSTSSQKSGKESEEALVVKRWLETDLLIIDEISMMSAEILNKLDYLGRNLRDVDKPLGGLQVVLSGDFCQLPPIGVNERYCFESEIWNKTISKTFALRQIVRQADPNLQAVLNEVREGRITMKGKELLNSRLIDSSSKVQTDHKPDENNKVRPTLIYPHRDRVNDINRQEFEALVANSDHKVFTYIYSDTMDLKPSFKGKLRPNIPERDLEEFLDQHCSAEKELHLCIGCQVMLTVNLDLESGLVNGSTGIISDFEDGLPVMTLSSGKSVKINKWTWAPDHPRYIIKRTQIPLILAWAITVHRSQGATLNMVQADLKEAFGPGMAYVILSRIKSLNGLYLEGINYSKIKCDPRVLNFYKNLK